MNRESDEDRLTLWVREHGQPLFGFLLRSVRNWALAEDLTQEVFARAWRHRAAYQELGQERAYLLRIAARLVRDHYRRPITAQLHTPEMEEPIAAETLPSAMLERVESEQELNEALDGLSPAQRQTLLLRYYGEMSFEEIAQTMQLPLNTVLSHAAPRTRGNAENFGERSMKPFPDDTLDSPEAEAQWQWLSGTLRATEPKVDLTAIAAGVRGKLRRRRLRIMSMAAGLLVAVGFVGWQLSRASLFSAAQQEPRMVVTSPTSPTDRVPGSDRRKGPEGKITAGPSLRSDPATRISQARRWQDELDRQLAGMQREIWRVRGSSRRLPTDADLIRGNLKQFEVAIRRSTL